jgi:hypothetical protein
MLNSDSITVDVLYRYQTGADPCIVFNLLVTEARYLNTLVTRTSVVFAIQFVTNRAAIFVTGPIQIR